MSTGCFSMSIEHKLSKHMPFVYLIRYAWNWTTRNQLDQKGIATKITVNCGMLTCVSQDPTPKWKQITTSSIKSKREKEEQTRQSTKFVNSLKRVYVENDKLFQPSSLTSRCSMEWKQVFFIANLSSTALLFFHREKTLCTQIIDFGFTRRIQETFIIKKQIRFQVVSFSFLSSNLLPASCFQLASS